LGRLVVVGASMAATLVAQLILHGCFCARCQPGKLAVSRKGDYYYMYLQGALLADDAHAKAYRHSLRTRKAGFTMAMLSGWKYDGTSEHKHRWVDAVAANSQTYVSAAVAAAARLMLWHWLQPGLYFAVLYCFWDQIDGLQQGFGIAVAVREVGYVAATLLCLYANPAYLLVDVWVSVRDKADAGANSGIGFLLTYTLAPEKFIFMAALGKGGLDVPGFKALAGLHLTDIYKDGGRVSFAGAALLLLLDLCGV
jgi:hypothetical protein